MFEKGFKIGVPFVDAQHEEMLKILFKLEKAVKEGRDEQEFSGIVEELVEYTRYHFSQEEQYMLDKGLPNYENHKRHHDNYTERILELQQKHLEDKKAMSEELIDIMKDWSISHVYNMDKRDLK